MTTTAGASKFFPKAQEGFTTTTSGLVASGASTVGLNSTGNYSNGDTVVLIIDPGVVGKEQSFTGVIDTSGVQVTGVVWLSGTNVPHVSGATVVDYVAAGHIDLISAGALVSHDASGNPKAGVTYPTPILTTPTITDFSNADHTHANNVGGGQLSGSAIATGSQLADRLLNPYKFSVYRNGAWTCGVSLATIVFDTKDFDTGTNFATGTGLFTAPIAGFYWFNTQVAATTSNGGNNLGQIVLIKNGSTTYVVGGWNIGAVSTNAYGGGGRLLQLAASDTVGIQATSSISISGLTGTLYTHFDGFLLSAT